jgi:sugar phosphate isomerase/epimerase
MAEIWLGINNAFALKNWPEPEAWAAIMAHDLGLKQVQFSFDLLDPLLPEPGRAELCAEVAQTAAQFGLELGSSFTGLIVYAQNHLAHPSPHVRGQAYRWYQAAIEVSARLGAKATGGHMGAMSVADFADPARRSELRAAVIDAVRGLTQDAAQHGQSCLLWEPMPDAREFPHTPQEAIAVLEEVNAGAAVPVQLCFDLGHCAPGPDGSVADPHAWLAELLPWTPIVHLQQTDGKGDRHWPFAPAYAEVGIVDPARVVEIARSSPLPRVDLVFEVSHAFDAAPQQILDDLRWSVEAWAKYL